MPEDFTHHARTSTEAIEMLESFREQGVYPELVSLDHDLGGDDTTRPIVLWWCTTLAWANAIAVHSANPVGVEWLTGMIDRYAPFGVRRKWLGQ